MSEDILGMALPVPCTAASLLIGLAAVPVQEVQTLLLEGDVLGAFQTVGAVLDFAVNPQGSWLARVSNQGVPDQELLVLDGAVVLHDGVLLWSLPDFIEGMHAAALDEAGGVALGVDLTFASSGLFHAGGLPLLTGDPVSPGIAWTRFGAVAAGDRATLLVRGGVDDPGVPGNDEEALVLVTLDPLGKRVLEQTLLAAEGHALAGLGSVVQIAGSGNGFALNSSGQTIFAAHTVLGGGVFLDGVPIALDGAPSPVPGFSWTSLLLSPVDRNDAGDAVFQGRLAPSGKALIRNGEVFAKVGSPLPAIVPYVLDELGVTVRLSNQGDVLWEGSWDHPDSALDGGLFRNGALLVQEGVTTAGSVVIDQLIDGPFPAPHGLEASDDGRFVAFWAELTGGQEGLFLLDLGAVEPVPGCFGNPATLAFTEGLAVPDGSLHVTLDGGQASGVLPFLAISDAPASGAPGCGIPVAGFGELLIDLTPPNPLVIQAGAPWLGAAVPIHVDVPASPALAGIELHAQGAFVDVAGAVPEEPLRATSGLRIVLGK
jgi:hypothetical protein